jgi:hypothetical protein
MRRLWTFWLACALALTAAVFAASAVAGDGQGHDDQGGGGQSSQQSSGGHDQSSQQKSSDQSSGGGDEKRSSNAQDESGRKSPDQKQTDQKQSDQKPKLTIRVVPNSTSGDHGSGGDNSADQSSASGVKSAQHTQSSSDVKRSDVTKKHDDHEQDVKPVVVQQTSSDHKVTLCHLTGNGAFVAITVDRHALKEGHTAAKGDIVPMPAAGCGAVLGAQATLGTTCIAGQSEHDDDESDDQGGQQGEFQGEHQDSQGSHESQDDDADEATECTTAATGTAGASVQILTPPAQLTAQAPAQQAAATQAVQQQTTTTTTTTASASVSASNAQPATQGTPNAAAAPQGQGGVLGATATLNSPKRSTGGVLGAAGNIAGASLPFTGFPVWLALLVALVLVAVGLVLRRGGGTATRL